MKKKEQTRMLLLAFFCIVFCGQTKAQVLTITKPDGLNYGFYMFGGCGIFGYSGTIKDLTIPATAYLDEEYENGYWGLASGYHNVGTVTGFADCQTLETVTIKNPGYLWISSDAFTRCPNLTTLYWPTCEYGSDIQNQAFKDCVKLKYITLPDSLSTIQNLAFSGCTSLTEIVFPKNFEYIGAASFEDCKSLTTIKFNEGKNLSIDNAAFKNCTSLKELTIPNRVTRIGPSAFEGCKNLTSLTFSEGDNPLEIIGGEGYAPFPGCNIKSLDLGRSINCSWNKVGLSSLQSVVIREGITTLIENFIY